jgi:HlyD family secretion protein
VDEPELGSVRVGQPVTLTWDAQPGQHWSGTVEKLPTQIVALGSRQVGEVQCVVFNPDRRLIPNTNVNAEISLAVVQNAITVPKEFIRRESNEEGVYLLQGNVVRWRKVKLGIASVTRRQVLEGLNEGDQVALPTDTPLKDGAPVRPMAGS